MNGFLKKHTKEIVCFVLLIVCTALLAFPLTLYPIVGIFGWAAYFYLFLGYLFAILHCAKKTPHLRAYSVIFLILSLIFIIGTVHLVFCDKTTVGTFSSFILGSHSRPSVGGALFGLILAPLVVYCTYAWSIVIMLFLSAIFVFLFLRPFIFNVKGGPFKAGTQEHTGKVIIPADSPLIRQLHSVEEPEPQSFNVSTEPESERDRARRLLLGDDGPETKDENERYFKNLLCGEESQEKGELERYVASVKLLDEDGSKSQNDWDAMVHDLGIDDKKEEKLFTEEDDPFSGKNSVVDRDFAAAVRQTKTQADAPAPLERTYSDEEEEDEEIEEIEEEVEEERPSPEVVYERLGRTTGGNGTEGVLPVRTPYEKPRETVTRDLTETTDETLIREYQFPPKSILQPHTNPDFVDYVENWDDLTDVIEHKLLNFGVTAKMVDATKGPTVTLVAIDIGDSGSVNKLIGAGKDLRRLLKANHDIAIIPQLPDTSYCGIEIPNRVRGIVSFQEVISSREYHEASGEILIALGKTSAGAVLVEDLAQMPHALIAGTTGSGKSVCINVILASILCRYRPDEVKLILIDLKKVELGIYSNLPHMLFKEPLSELPQIVNALKWIRQETEERFNKFKSLHVRNLKEYNKLPDVNRLPRIVIVIDEASELMTQATVRKTVEGTLSSLARVARAAGVHLLFATQNPVKEVITNEIQNNLNTKIAFAVGDYNHSMVIFKAKGAECLLGNGDMYIKRGNDMRRGQCAYISTEETEAIVNYIVKNNAANFDEEMIARILNGSTTEGGDTVELGYEGEEKSLRDPKMAAIESKREKKAQSEEAMMWQALKICYDSKYISISYLQRKMAKGYNAVATIVEYWEKEGYISKPGADKKRYFLRSPEEFYAAYRERFGDEDMPFDEENPEE